MKIQKFDPQGFAYGVPCQGLFPWKDVAATPFGAMWCVVPPGQTIKPHRHHEGETYIVAYGQGEMVVGDERVPVGPGDAIFVDPFDLHAMVNTATEGDLLFLAVYWEDMPLAAASGAERAASAAQAPAPKRVLITATPPTPNGDLHVAHHCADEIVATLKQARIEVDHFARPKSSPHHVKEVQALFSRLWEKGALVAREAPTLWCETCQKYLF